MIIVIANVFLKRDKISEFVEASKSCILETRKEEENISYTLLASTDDCTCFTFLEKWQSMDALNKHMKSEHFISFGSSIENLVAKPLEINIFDANELKK